MGFVVPGMRRLAVCGVFVLTSLALIMPLSAPAAGDSPDGTARLRKALAASPENGGVMWALAKAEAAAGRAAEACSWIERVLGQGLDVNLDDPAFRMLRNRPAFEKLAARAAASRFGPGRSTVLFTIPEKDLIPEGIAYDPIEGAYYAGSILKKKIVRVLRGGRVEDFTSSGQDGLWSVLGLRVQVKERLLWAVCRAEKTEGPDEGKTGVFVFDMGTRKLARKLILENGPGKHLLNDLVVTPRGEAFITDTDAGALWRVRPGSDAFEAFIPPGTFTYPNGIAQSPDGSTLFVADFSRGISRVQVTSGSIEPLPHPANVSIAGIDGLYLDRDGLVAVQNEIPLARVVRYNLSPDLRRIVSARVLEARHPRFAIPTTGALTGDFLALLATSRLDALDESGRLRPDAALGEVVVLEVPLR